MNSYSSKDIAIAILNWNGKDLLETFIPNVLEYSNHAQTYVIDNASTDGSVAFIKSNFLDVKVIPLHTNLGYAGGYNEAVKHIPEPIVCFLNSDVDVSPQWLQPVLEIFNTHSTAAFVQPKILDYKNKAYFEYAGAAGGFIDKFGYPYCRGRLFDSLEKDEQQYNDDTQIFWASGACLFGLKSRFIDLGGFDTSYFAHMEEIDLCWRAFNRGDEIWYTGASTVYHVGGASLSHQSPKKTFLNFRNSLFNLVKNSPSPLLLVFQRLVLDGLAGLKFLASLQFLHFLAIIKAHLSFYIHLPEMLKKRKELPKPKPHYYSIRSIVWEHFFKRKTKV